MAMVTARGAAACGVVFLLHCIAAAAAGAAPSLAEGPRSWTVVDAAHALVRVELSAAEASGATGLLQMRATCNNAPNNAPLAPFSERGGDCDWCGAVGTLDAATGRVRLTFGRRAEGAGALGECDWAAATGASASAPVAGRLLEDGKTLQWDAIEASESGAPAWVPSGIAMPVQRSRSRSEGAASASPALQGLRWAPQVPIKTVHLVYMTHLDVGYTLDSSLAVQNLYFETFFPKAYKTSSDLRAMGGNASFVWTTHPWLLDQYLNNATGNVTAANIADLEAAIARGDIQWHAGAFNLESEVAEPSLYSFGLDISRELSQRFSKPAPITASQKDVPGSTIGAVPIMVAAGVSALHVGVNDFSRPPAVPARSPLLYAPVAPFVWREPQSGADVVAYWSSGYSRPPWGCIPELIVNVPGSDTALAFLMMVDNRGPVNATQVQQGWRALSTVFPGAQVHVSSLDAYTETVAQPAVKATLPVVSRELGDTWIQGIAADPFKCSAYRVAARARAAALADGSASMGDARVRAFSRLLVKLPEHTWGWNEGPLMGVNHSNAYFDANLDTAAFQMAQSSWTEQRAYINASIEALGDHPLAARIRAETAAAGVNVPVFPSLAGLQAWATPSATPPMTCGGVRVAFTDTGAISSLVDTASGRVWADINATSTATTATAAAATTAAASGAAGELGVQHVLGRLVYATHDEHEFDTYVEAYLNPPCSGECGGCGFAKCGINATGATRGEYDAMPVAAWRSPSATSAPEATCRFVFNVTFAASLQSKYGAPAYASLDYSIAGRTVNLTTRWFKKRPTRMAESIWLTFAPPQAPPTGWQLHKLGLWVSPLDVVVNGSRNLHGVWDGVRYADEGAAGLDATAAQARAHARASLLRAGTPRAMAATSESPAAASASAAAVGAVAAAAAAGSLAIGSPDAPLVAVQRRSPIYFVHNETQPDMAAGLHFGLFNNAWDTNYPVWSPRTEESFRFSLTLAD